MAGVFARFVVQRKIVSFKGWGMEGTARFWNFVAGICLATVSGMAYADDFGMSPESPAASSFYSGNFQSANPRYYQLAANENEAIQETADKSPVVPSAPFEPPWLSGRQAHHYLGVATVITAGLTALTAPGEACKRNCPQPAPPRQTSGTTHTRLARATAVLAVATVVTGLIYHWDDFHLEDGLADPDNQHVMLAGTGALLMLYAINKSEKSSVPTSHAAIAEAGAGAMLLAIKLTW
jgi:hypothetical protein